MSEELFEDLNAFLAQVQHWRLSSRIPKIIRQDAGVLQGRLSMHLDPELAARDAEEEGTDVGGQAPVATGEDQFSDEVVEDDS